MDLITPDFGLIFWQIIILLAVLWILKRFAWKPILKTIKARENFIEQALTAAQKAKKEVEQLHVTNAKLLEEAKTERDALLKDALATKNSLLAAAKKETQQLTEKMMEKAKAAIEHEKQMAIMTLKNQIAELSTQIAERFMQKALEKQADQEALVDKLIETADWR